MIRLKVIKLKLDEHIKKLGIQQKEFAEISGLRPATVSMIVNNKYDRLQLTHIVAIMEALEIQDFNEIFELVEE